MTLTHELGLDIPNTSRTPKTQF